MAWWREHAVPRMADRFLSNDEVARLRERACAGLSGEVLEIGFGSGLNLAHYPQTVTRVWAVEPSDLAWRLAQPRMRPGGAPVTRAGLDGAHLDLPDRRFDSVLSTFTMCTIPEIDAALAEIHRVLRPGGSLHFLEHGRSPEGKVARWQERLQPVYGPVAGGCHLTRPIAEHIRGGGLHITELDTFYLSGPKLFGYTYLGRASV